MTQIHTQPQVRVVGDRLQAHVILNAQKEKEPSHCWGKEGREEKVASKLEIEAGLVFSTFFKKTRIKKEYKLPK